MNQIPDLPQLFLPPTSVPAGLHFRLVQPDDLRPLYTNCYSQQPFRRFRTHFRRLLGRQQNGRCYWLVAVSEDGIVGSGHLMRYQHSAELANLSVMPAQRCRGIGTALIEILTAMARHQGWSPLEIGVTSDNPRALALYQRLHFVEDRRVRLLDGSEAIFLCKEL